MARSVMKNVAVIMTIIMFILAQASYSLPTRPIAIVRCAAKCAVQCANKLDEELKYVECVAGCGLACNNISSPAAYQCTTGCAYSKLNSIKTDARDVNAIVNSCLKSC
ncbi:uncharacterized protein LOC131629587 [Vicia villosa]|uniref:uncharacterized protein LOC131599370 n=1 Tax=Vicia villosa TaxID=3911 RepID=UPI00273A751F|nr:uncharacterized protein LOC131599370 [Vicia villosa]XP_058727736.1 uncharacterized protein LOC131599371 [Vicia villosa]XP_058756349.1 uncharacterized protein LOC131629587 [Vicia villosa]